MYELQTDQHREQAVLCGLDTGAYDAETSMAELKELARTAGADTAAVVIQKRPAPDAALFLGVGRLREIVDFCSTRTGEERIDLLIFDDELTPSQQWNIEKFTGLRVVDRTTLILDIFAGRARSREGRLQVELAQLQYRLPRIIGKGTSLSRLGGGIGTRGPGESKLESDRRHIMRRITAIQKELRAVEKRRSTARARREKSGTETVVLVGYTNAGKSTLMNALTDAGVLAEDELFATLDPTARSLRLPSGRDVILIDTVGLVRRLPHKLVEAFHSTLEEAASADVILNVCDASSPEFQEHLQVTADLLHNIGAAGRPTISVLNKCDRISHPDLLPLPDAGPAKSGGLSDGRAVMISALNKRGIPELLRAIENALPKDRIRCTFLFPFDALPASDEVRRDGVVYKENYTDAGLEMDVLCSSRMAGKYQKYTEGIFTIK